MNGAMVIVNVKHGAYPISYFVDLHFYNLSGDLLVWRTKYTVSALCNLVLQKFNIQMGIELVLDFLADERCTQFHMEK